MVSLSSSATVSEINATTAALQAAGGGHVRLANGVYSVDTAVLLRPGVRISGSKTGTIFRPAEGYEDALVDTAAPPEGEYFARHLELSRVTLDGVSKVATGLKLYKAAEVAIDGVIITKCVVGLDIEDSIVCDVSWSKIHGNERGVIMRTRTTSTSINSSTRVQSSDYENVTVYGAGTMGIRISGVIESAGIVGSASPGIAIRSGVMGFRIVEAHIESNKNASGGQILVEHDDEEEAVPMGTIAANWITAGSGSAAHAIDLQGGRGIVVKDNQTAGHTGVTVNIGADSVQAEVYASASSDVGAAVGGAGIPAVLSDDGTMRLSGGIDLAGTGTQYVRKTTAGNLVVQSVEGASVYANDNEFARPTP